MTNTSWRNAGSARGFPCLLWASFVLIVGEGLPRLCIQVYDRFVDSTPLPEPWIEVAGMYVYTLAQAVGLVAIAWLGGYSMRGLVVGSGKWLAPTWFLKVFSILVLTGISLDYLWELPWFYMHPEKLTTLSAETWTELSDGNESYAATRDALTTFLLLVVGPIVEEVLYRGLLLHALAKAMPLRWAILVSALVFVGTHADPVAAAAFGVLVSVVYLQTGSLFSAILLHVAYNALIRAMGYISEVLPNWYLSYNLFRPGAWWLHATILIGSAALTFEYIAALRRSREWPPALPSIRAKSKSDTAS